MKKYKTLLFDADETLLDFNAAEKQALHFLFEEQHFPLTAEIEAHYKKLNQGLWKAYEEGELERDEVVNTRFATLFKEYGLEVDGTAMEQKYRRFLAEGHKLIEGAFDLIKELHKDFDLYIVTNGIADTQYKRLRDSGLYPFFRDVFVSETAGHQKPTKAFFDYVFSKIPGCSLDECLIIGDSLNADIKGGNGAGIATCWLNPGMLANHTDIIPTYEVHKLDELYRIIDSEAK